MMDKNIKLRIHIIHTFNWKPSASLFYVIKNTVKLYLAGSVLYYVITIVLYITEF